MTPYTFTRLLCLLVFVQWSFLVEGSHFRHAVMSFVPTDADNNTLRFTFRLALRRSYYSYYCDENTINLGGIIGSGGSWTAKCSDPFSAVCSPSYYIADTRFRCTDFSRNEDWSMGENNFTYTFPSGNLEWNVRYQSCCWISNLVRYADSQWSVSTKISLSRRSDSGKINSSPVSKSPAIVRFQQGCHKSLTIPVEDPDGDFVKCRWATSAESSIPSDSFPYGELDEKNCILTYRGGLGASGTYVVTLTLEDFPAGTTNFNNIRPFSAVPLQFLVIIGVGFGSCQDIPVFTSSTPQNGECSEIQIGSVYKAVIEVRLPNVSKHIVEITTSSPLGMQLTPLSSHGGIFFRNVTWYPSQNQIGQQLFCFQALDSDGLQSEWRCVTILVGLSNTPHVILGTRRPISPISEIGTGLIWWSIHFNRVIKKPRSPAFIRLVLQSNGFTVFKVNALSGYVVIDSNRTVLHFATPKAALSMNGSYAILIDPGAVVGQGCSNDGPPTPGITSPMDWTFPVDGVCPLGYALVSPSFQKCEDIDECGGHHRSKRSYWWYNVFSQNSACNATGEFINSTSGHISSYNFPGNYDPNRICTWNITVPRGKIIKLTFLNFTLVAGENDDCAGAARDSARVFITNVASHGGKPNDFKICGQKLPPPVYSEGNFIQVRFESRTGLVNKGFNATFEAIDRDSLCPTDMILNETSGSFSSPFYPRNYPFNQACSWKIIGKQGYRVELTIPDYNLQPCGGAACSCDYMEVQNSFSDEALPGKLCAAPTRTPVKFYSLHESLRVVFVSDDANMDFYGFSATYKLLNYSPPICPNEAIPLSGSGKISSTNYPKSNYNASRNCTWNITAPADKIVKFTFTDFVLSECSAHPCLDSCSYVELYDGGSTTSRSLGRFCQSSSWSESQFSSGNQMFVTFHPGQNVDRGFEAKYECTTEPPTTTVLGSYGTTISVSSEVSSTYLVVSGIQSTPSLPLDSSTSAVVPSTILNSASESSFGTTISVSSQVSSSVPDIQSTASLLLDGSTSTVVPLPSLISASESSFGTTVGVSSEVSSSVPDIQFTASLLLDGSTSTVVPLPSLLSASESSFGTTISVSSEVSSSVPSIQSTSSIILNSSTPAVVPTQSLISEGLSQSQSITPSTTSSIGKSFSNSSIEQVSASPSFSSHESVRTSSSLLHGGSTPSVETSRIATPSSVVDHISLCECPCDTSSTFSAEKSSSVSDSESLSSFVSMDFAQTASVSGKNSWSLYDSESLASSTSMVFAQTASFSGENSSSVYVSKNLSSSASSVFTQSPSVYAENSWSVYGSESLPLQASSSLMQDSPVPGRTSSLWYDSRSPTSSASSVGLKTVSSTNTYKISSSSTSTVCYCPCNRSTVFPSPSSSMSISASKTPSPMYPYGPQQKDNEYGLDDSPYYYYDRCRKINTDWTGIPFFSERHYKLYICRNGIIQLNYDWSWWWPRKFGVYWWFRNMGIIAPFWATTDSYFAFRYNHSKVYYQVYNQTHEKSNETLAMASEHVKSYTGGFDDFEATWVLVVTWEKLCPYAYYPYYYYYQNINEKDFQLKCSRSNTFQAVLITNGFNTFLMYNYHYGGIQWVVDADPNNYRYWTSYYGLPVAGWNAGNGGENYFNIKGSGTFEMYDLDKKEGNTGVQGRYFWRIENSDGQGALEKCFSWVLLNEHSRFRYWYKRLIESDREMACPCTVWQAWFDWGRFRWSWWNSWPDRCFDSRRSRFFYFYTRNNGLVGVSMRQKCCYSTEWEDWGSLKQGPPDGGRVEVTLYYYWYNRVQTFYTDEEAYQYCCVDLPFCHLFYAYRPSDSCSLYRPPIRRWFWGDPHIKTLDGGNYTFNGLGEYTMVDAENGTFNLQARTKLAQGNSTTATIFSAGAAKEKNSSTIEVRVKDGGGLHILIDSTPYNGYKNLTNRTVEVGRNLSISKPEENCLQVSFPSTSSVQFCENKEMMSFVVTLGDVLKNATKGLLGTWNDDPNDDFTLPNGTVLPSTSSLKEIHYGFGVKWQINQSQSLFTYADNESVATYSDPEFEPMFADNIKWHNDSLKQKAEAQCGDDHECLFDVASTKDLSIGSATKEISVQLVNDTKKLNNFPPKIINTSEVINVTLHEIVELNITAVDDGTITFRVINKPVGATWNQTGAVLLFYWNATSSKKFSLTFVAVDDQDASAIWSPTIKMCACQHDGQCVEPEEGDANNTDSKFIYMGCECQGGYTGRFCDRDIDACEVNGQPCYAGVDCTDLPPPANSTGYECGPCPSGYNGDGAQCVDIDECQSNPCKQKCVNVPASFFCDCDNGYKLNDDGRSCGDINECLPTNDCMQKCDNSVGSYNCSCDEYFKTDPTDWRKCVAKDPCISGHGCSHVCFKGSSGRATCACYANFELQSDGKTCKDINECDPAKELHRCSQTCINTEGSYNCSCTEGYELKKDGYECEDINECLNDDLYSCTDDFHKCVNTRGSYKCECEQDLYFIDGKCQGLENGQPVPKQPPPKPKNASEYEKEQAVQFSIPSRVEWDFNRDKSFKEVLARVASDFCNENRTKCGLKNSRRNRRSLYDIYTADEVHLLPGYPKNSSDSLQVAFYVKQPAGGFIGNNSVLHRDTLVFIIRAYKSNIEKAIGANITDIETLFKPSTTTESPTAGPAEPADDDWKWIVIGVVIGVVVIILIGLLIFCMRKRKRDVKPITDPSQEGIAAQQSGLKKENSFESGSHSA